MTNRRLYTTAGPLQGRFFLAIWWHLIPLPATTKKT